MQPMEDMTEPNHLGLWDPVAHERMDISPQALQR